MTPKPKPKSRSGTSRTEAQLLAVGWAPQIKLRLRVDELEKLERRCDPNETVQARIRRWINSGK